MWNNVDFWEACRTRDTDKVQALFDRVPLDAQVEGMHIAIGQSSYTVLQCCIERKISDPGIFDHIFRDLITPETRYKVCWMLLQGGYRPQSVMILRACLYWRFVRIVKLFVFYGCLLPWEIKEVFECEPTVAHYCSARLLLAKCPCALRDIIRRLYTSYLEDEWM